MSRYRMHIRIENEEGVEIDENHIEIVGAHNDKKAILMAQSYIGCVNKFCLTPEAKKLGMANQKRYLLEVTKEIFRSNNHWEDKIFPAKTKPKP